MLKPHLFISLLLSWLPVAGLSGLALAQTDPPGSITLDAPASLQVDIPSTQVLSSGSAASDQVNSPLQLLAPPPFTRFFSEAFNPLWQAEIPFGVAPEEIEVVYQVFSLEGEADVFSNLANPDATLPVEIDPLPLEVLPVGEDRTLVNGSINLIVETQAAEVDGTYAGRIAITLTVTSL